MDNNADEKILSDIGKGYDLISDKFSSTRAFMWRDLEFVRDMVKPGDRVLDFGCGNGRLAGFLGFGRNEPAFAKASAGKYVGIDISGKLIEIAKQKYSSEKTKFVKLAAASKRSDRAANKESGRTTWQLPFPDNHFDIIFSIAVFHHFPSKEYALQVAKELNRVLKPRGKIVITVWNLWQERFLRSGLKNEKGWKEMYIPFKSGDKEFKRYHHPFRMSELKELFEQAGFNTLETKEGRNLLYIGEK